MTLIGSLVSGAGGRHPKRICALIQFVFPPQVRVNSFVKMMISSRNVVCSGRVEECVVQEEHHTTYYHM